MIISYLVIVLTCLCASGSSLESDNICHYNYDYKCAGRINKYNISYNDQMKSCTIDSIPKEVTYTIMLDEKNSSSRGVVNVDFKSPTFQCIYKVALFVNPFINNVKDCVQYQFNENNAAEIHTLEKTICPKYENETGKREQETIQIESSCKENNLTLWYEYIYTGCYALGFRVDKNYIFAGKELLKTDYKKVEVEEPKLTCTYEPTTSGNESSMEIITLAADISLLAESSGLKFQVAPIIPLDNHKHLCNLYSDNPIISLFLPGITANNGTNSVNDCTLNTTSLPNGDSTKKLKCNFFIQNLKEVGYCFLVNIVDERCHKNTSWMPPIQDKIPCSWAQYCMKTDQNKSEKNKDPVTEILKRSKTLYIVIFIILLIGFIGFCVYCCIRSHRVNVGSAKTPLREKINEFHDDASAVLELDSTNSQKEHLVKNSRIVILYVRETDQFMNFMSEFRKSLKHHTGCDVYDWWAPDLWNDVARVGGYEWVVKMIRKDCRVVWIDTLKARKLFALQHKNGFDKFKQLKYISQSQEISDFRDSVFPAIVDFAKRNYQDLDQEYQKYFIVRLETFDHADRTEDPFADLSPHVRYLIPCHFDKLCCQLSIRELHYEEINMEKIRLGKYLQDSVANF